MNKARILVIDDDPSVRRIIRRTLEAENYSVVEGSNGDAAIAELMANPMDLLILDINMEGMDGFEVIQELRKRDIDIPVFILSGRSEDYDIIMGYGISADAYITKPFSPAVLAAMVKSQIKKKNRTSFSSGNYVNLPPFRFDKNNYVLYKNNAEVVLSAKEAKLMRFFMENNNKVFTKDQIYRSVWNQMAISDNNIMVFIRKLRIKIEDDANNPKYLKTVWGIGYTFAVNPEK